MSTTKYGTVDNVELKTPKDKLQQTHEKLNEVTVVMKDNIDKVIKRGEDLDQLDEKATHLEHNAEQFKNNATKVKRKFQCQHYKLIALVAFVIMILILIIVLATKPWK